MNILSLKLNRQAGRVEYGSLFYSPPLIITLHFTSHLNLEWHKSHNGLTIVMLNEIPTNNAWNKSQMPNIFEQDLNGEEQFKITN